MTTLLHINSSLHGTKGESSRLASRFVAGWRARHPGACVIERDLAATPPPHLTAERFQAFVTPPEQRSAAQQAEVATSDAWIAELRAAEVIVLGLPMYNFGVPSTLKAWLDHVARAGITFRYTANGPVGLLTGKRAYVFATRGGAYAGTPRDTQTPYVREFLGFLGIDEVEFIHAEGLALGEERKRAALDSATAQIDDLLPALGAAA
jgi:Acyl carrier protein phosphodiesterase